MEKRTSWHDYFSKMATLVSERATCVRKKVGCVLVLNNRVISTGYNGSLGSLPHCTEVGCDIKDNHCVRTIHAELNAILDAAKRGVNINNAIAYVTVNPCWNCFKSLVQAGIKKIYYQEYYAFKPEEEKRMEDAVKFLGIELKKI